MGKPVKGGKNGNAGMIIIREKGDPPHPGGGRREGSPNYNTILRRIMETDMEIKDAVGTRKVSSAEAMFLDLLQISIRSKDENTRLKAKGMIMKQIMPADEGDKKGSADVSIGFPTEAETEI